MSLPDIRSTKGTAALKEEEKEEDAKLMNNTSLSPFRRAENNVMRNPRTGEICGATFVGSEGDSGDVRSQIKEESVKACPETHGR